MVKSSDDETIHDRGTFIRNQKEYNNMRIVSNTRELQQTENQIISRSAVVPPQRRVTITKNNIAIIISIAAIILSFYAIWISIRVYDTLEMLLDGLANIK